MTTRSVNLVLYSFNVLERGLECVFFGSECGGRSMS